MIEQCQSKEDSPIRTLIIRTFLIAGICTAFITPASAHHSAALFYDIEGGRISLTGTVQRFNFRNPHAILELIVINDAGEEQLWLAETSAPSALRRRGWSQQSFTDGETVTLDGIKAKDGSYLMRITKATKADGSVVGASINFDE